MELCIDTCTNVCSVAAVCDGKILAERTYNDKLRHSEILMVEIDEMLKRLNVEPSALSKIYVTNGPGSFTGIRIGVTAANTLADSLSIPVCSYSILDVYAGGFRYSHNFIVSMLYARNDRYYFSIYKAEDGKLEMMRPYDVLTIDEILDEVKSNYDEVVFTGDIFESHIDKMNTCGTVALGMLPRSSMMPFLDIEGRDDYAKDDMINDTFIKPTYLEKSQAEKMANKNV